jgi:hypothetical protein
MRIGAAVSAHLGQACAECDPRHIWSWDLGSFRLYSLRLTPFVAG